MIHKTIFSVLISLCCIGTCIAQQRECSTVRTDSIVEYMKHAMMFNANTPQEKVYLHFDNTGYFKGETIWFKAYVTRADKALPTDISRVLYVELVNPTGDVVERRKLRIGDDGTAYGDIRLDSIYGSGFYETRAFTRYMTNWGGAGIFSRVFPIFNAPKEEGGYSSMVIDKVNYRNRLPDMREKGGEEEKATRKDADVRFFPEGGNLVKGLKSRVAFTVSTDGRAAQTGASIEDMDGNVIGTANSDAEGRGVFDFTPDGSPVFLRINGEGGRGRKIPLPEAQEEGCVMRVNTMEDEEITVAMAASARMEGRLLGYVLMNNGNMVKCDTLTARSAQTISFYRYSLPKGVNMLTLFTSDGRIVAERMFFIPPEEDARDSVKVRIKELSPKPCGKVSLSLEAAPNSSLSFTAVDAGTMTNGKEGNIRTWMLLSSEVKGYIAHPEYYFEADDGEHRAAADLLMMTQGWRRYDWELMSGRKGFEGETQPVEDALYVFGRLRKLKKKNTVENVDLSAYLFNSEGASLKGKTVTDSTGFYAFRLPDMEGEWNMQIVTEKDDEPTNYQVTINRNFSPPARYVEEGETGFAERNVPNLTVDAGKTEEEEYVPLIKRDNLLKTVKIKGRKRFTDGARAAWETERNGQRWASLYYDCDAASDEINDKGEIMPPLFEWLFKKNNLFTGSPVITSQKFSIDLGREHPMLDEGPSYKNRPIVWLINNNFGFMTGLKSEDEAEKADIVHVIRESNVLIRPEFLDEVKSVYITESEHVLKNYMVSNVNVLKPVTIFVYTHLSNPWKTKGLRRTHFYGYNKPSTFQMEDYGVLPPMEDFRRTLYWEPNVRTDGKGEAHVEFYNNSSCKQMYISVEGMSQEGDFMINE